MTGQDDGDEDPMAEATKILDMITWTEGEAERLEIWARAVADPDARRRILGNAHIARMTVKTLDILRAHEAEFVKMVSTGREVEQRRKKSAAR